MSLLFLDSYTHLYIIDVHTHGFRPVVFPHKELYFLKYVCVMVEVPKAKML